jgi:CubicO group peptidase (beta-lactamase class C family)
MSIHFHHDHKNYNIKLIEGKNSDLTLVIHGVAYSVTAAREQLADVRKILHPIFSDSFSSIGQLSDRIGQLEGVSAVKVQKIATDILRPSSPGSEIAEVVQKNMRELNIPGASIAVIDGSEIAWSAGYGDLARPVLIQAASISKTVTALAVLSLIQDKIIDLDTDVSTLLPPPLWRSIDPEGLLEGEHPKMTIRELLSHTAGTTVGGFRGYLRGKEIDDEILLLTGQIDSLRHQEGASHEIVRLGKRLEELETCRLEVREVPTLDGILRGEGNSRRVQVVAIPGTRVEYSGGGTTILQKVLEVVTGKRFEEIVQERVFDPLDMSHSTYRPEILPVSSGHGADGADIPGQWMIHPELAAAGLWTTPVDLAKMACGIQRSIAHERGAILSPTLAKEMSSSQTVLNRRMGLGLFIQKNPHSTYFFHRGNNIGFRCALFFNSNGQGAVVMTNSESGDRLNDEVISTIARVYHWPDADTFSSLSDGEDEWPEVL